MSIFSLGDDSPIERLRGSGEFESFLVGFADRLNAEEQSADDMFNAMAAFVENTGKAYADMSNVIGKATGFGIDLSPEETNAANEANKVAGETILTSSYEPLDSESKYLDSLKPSEPEITQEARKVRPVIPVETPDNPVENRRAEVFRIHDEIERKRNEVDRESKKVA